MVFWSCPQDILAQTCSGFVPGTHMYCINKPPGWDDECRSMPTTQNCTYRPVTDTCEVSSVHNDTGCKGKMSGVGDTLWWDCTGVYSNPYREVCGPPDEEGGGGGTPAPGATPTPMPPTTAIFTFVFDTDHNGLFDSEAVICTDLGSVDRYIRGNTSCAGCVAYRTESGYQAGGLAHHNQCIVSVSSATPETKITMTTSPQIVDLVLPAGLYVINRLSTNTCSMVDGDSLKYSCPNGGTATLLVSDVQNVCDISVTGPWSLTVGQTGNLTVSKIGSGAVTGIWISGSVPNPDGTISYSGDPVFWDGTAPYTDFTITGESAGGVTVTVTGINSATGIQCSATHSLTVTASLQPWWVTFGGDVTAGKSIYALDVPSGQYLFNWLPTLSSGIPIFGNSLLIGSDQISDTGRFANTNTYNLGTTYTALLAKAAKTVSFITLAPGTHNLADITSSPDAQGWEWYKTEGDLILDDAGAFTFSSRKLVVFVEGNLTVNKNIQCVDGVGMPVFIVSGNITFNSTVAAPTTLFEGAYYAGGNTGITFNTNGVDTDPTLTVRAIVVAQNGSVTSYRDSGVGNTVPAVYFRRTPDLMFLMPSFMRSKKSLWREVAP